MFESPVKAGYKFKLEFECARPVTSGESYNGKTLDNKYQNLWWARPTELPLPEIVVCAEGLDYELSKLTDPDQHAKNMRELAEMDKAMFPEKQKPQ